MPAPKIPRLFVIVVMPLIDTQFPPLLPQRPIRHFITFPSFWHSRDLGAADIASCGASRDFTDLTVDNVDSRNLQLNTLGIASRSLVAI